MSEFEALIKSTPGLGQMAIAKKMVDAVSSGQMSEYRFGQFQMELCKAMFPNDSPGRHAQGDEYRSRSHPVGTATRGDDCAE